MNSRLQSLVRDRQGENEPGYYLIGEIAYNHEGDLDHALKNIDALGRTRSDAIKIHVLLDIEEYMTRTNYDYDKRLTWLWSVEQYGKAIDQILAHKKEAVVMADDTRSIDYLIDRRDIAGIEIHAVCLNDTKMLEALCRYNGVILLGIGGTTLDEIESAVRYLQSRGKRDIVLMYGIQTYPTQFEKINLHKMKKLRDLFGVEIGYADHTAWDHPQNTFVSSFGYLMGFRILEKHYTTDYGVKRIDYEAAIGHEQLEDLFSKLDTIKAALGDGALSLNEAESHYGRIGPMKKAIVASKDLPAGHKIDALDLALKRTGPLTYMKQTFLPLLVGRKLRQAVKKDESIDFSILDVE